VWVAMGDPEGEASSKRSSLIYGAKLGNGRRKGADWSTRQRRGPRPSGRGYREHRVTGRMTYQKEKKRRELVQGKIVRLGGAKHCGIGGERKVVTGMHKNGKARESRISKSKRGGGSRGGGGGFY